VVIDERAVFLAVAARPHPMRSGLGTGEGTTIAQRSKSHPDKVMGLAREFQELTDRKTANYVPGTSAMSRKRPEVLPTQPAKACPGSEEVFLILILPAHSWHL
jgi:hypothetical protein